MKSCYLVDIDGTVADATHRLHFITERPKNWNAFFANVKDDVPYDHIRQLLWHLINNDDVVIVYVTGRPQRCLNDTIEWMRKRVFPLGALYMRADDDYRADDIVKKELLDQLRRDGYDPIMAFDDRDRVVEMWRANGVPCAQVRKGDF